MSDEGERVRTAGMTSLNRSTGEFRSSAITADLCLPGLLGKVFFNDSNNCSTSEDGNVTLGSLRVTSGSTQKNWVALLILLAIIVTVAGNILVIMAVSLERKLQNATNYFLMSLAITDMLLGLLVMPVAMVTILYNYTWPFPFALCPVWIYLDVLFSTASIMHLCAISLDRYIAIRNPIQHSRSNSRARARVKITAAWTISVGISMPVPVLGVHDHSKVFQDGSCQLTDNSFVLIGSFVAFFVPLLIMVVTYFLTISALQSQATMCLDQLMVRPKWLSMLELLPRGSLSSERLFGRGSLCPDSIVGTSRPFGRRTMQSISNEQKASKVLGVVFFLFVIMWCPFFITNVMAVVCDSSACDPTLMAGLLNVFVWVGYLSSAVNPLVYTLFNKTYRAAFARYMRCSYREKRRPLQVILVNTIPPLAFDSSKLPLQGSISLRRSTEGSGSGGSPTMNQTESTNLQNKCETDERVSHV
ncbi:5-hydroxytryptamine receptor 2A [Colossoma macropomum]|uniref:5-hydroxytryptamine receptor 2A n=1 Tax=Colossoma macropomum TaxID=42526 RepID=UPI0018651978|nr:5-hydroxytryptamine receptor 2A [Colossoma macropomum]